MNVYRHSRPDGADEESSASSFKYPLGNLPTLESHVQPHWVVLNAGMKLDSRTPCEMDSSTDAIGIGDVPVEEDAIDFIQELITLNSKWRSITAANDLTRQEVALYKVALPKVVSPEIASPEVALLQVASPHYRLHRPRLHRSGLRRPWAPQQPRLHHPRLRM